MRLLVILHVWFDGHDPPPQGTTSELDASGLKVRVAGDIDTGADAVARLLAYRGVETDHIAIRTASYSGIDQQNKEVRVYALGYLIDVLDPEHRLLVIDDVFDTGRSIEAFLTELKTRCRHNMPATIKVATAYYKPSRNQTALKPDYFVHQTEEWLVFPHEICGLTEAEIRKHKPGAAAILRS